MGPIPLRASELREALEERYIDPQHEFRRRGERKRKEEDAPGWRGADTTQHSPTPTEKKQQTLDKTAKTTEEGEKKRTEMLKKEIQVLKGLTKKTKDGKTQKVEKRVQKLGMKKKGMKK